MKFQFQAKGAEAFSTPLLVVFGFEKEKGAELLSEVSVPEKAMGDFTGKFRSHLLCYPGEGVGAERILVFGLGRKEKLSTEEIRRISALAYQHAKSLRVSSYAMQFGKGIEAKLNAFDFGAAVAEGSVLGGYSFERFKSSGSEEEEKKAPQRCEIFGLSATAQKGFEWGKIGAECQCYVRDLANLPSNEKYPRIIAGWAQQLVKGDSRFSSRVYDEKEIKKLGMGALLGVGRGSDEPPRLVVLKYKPKSKAKKKFCLVGKGVTFDSGGISLKPSGNMDEMKYDMSGGAAVMGFFRALKQLDMPHEFIGVIPFTENLPGGNAQKPGDIVTAYNGKTIEVLNTDAEGRLILADALSFAVKEFQPDAIFDIATLTGAVGVALGHELAGVLGNDRKLAAAVIATGERVGEAFWELPILDAHKEMMKSAVADLKNIAAPNMGAGASAGGAFLSYFVGETPWAHLDIAGAAWGGKDRDYYKRGSAGIGVRFFLDFFRNQR